MKKLIYTQLIFLFSILTCFSQGEVDFEGFTIKTQEEQKLKNNYVSSPGTMMHNGKEMPTVIVLVDGKSYTVSDGFINGNKKMLNSDEVESRLSQFSSSDFNYVNSTILITNQKPYLVALFKNDKKKIKETLIIPLVEENNFLKLEGNPIKRTTVLGKSIIKVYPPIKIFENEFVGNLALMK